MSNSNLSSNDKENLGPSNMERFKYGKICQVFFFKANFLFVTDVFKLKKNHTEICLERVHAILL